MEPISKHTLLAYLVLQKCFYSLLQTNLCLWEIVTVA